MEPRETLYAECVEAIENYHKPTTTKAKVATTPIDEEPPFNLENVQEVIAEIRPFLKEHGGNVKVDHVDEENRNVDVTLEGQCATCPLATTLQPCKEVLRAGLQPRKNRVVDSAKSCVSNIRKKQTRGIHTSRHSSTRLLLLIYIYSTQC